MIQILKELNLIPFFLAILSIAGMSLGLVYIFGRMLGIVENYRIKNVIALLGIIGFTYLYLTTFGFNKNFLYNYFLHSLTSILIYTLFGMRLFAHMDTFLDKRIGKDKEIFKRRRKKK